MSDETSIVERLRISANLQREVAASAAENREGIVTEAAFYQRRSRLEFEAAAEIERLAARVKELEDTRAKTIEECAKIAETMKVGPIYYVDGRPNAAHVIGGDVIATAIRALNEEGK